MKNSEIIELIKNQNSALIKDVGVKKATLLIRLALEQLAVNISEADEGLIRVPALGQFNVRNVEREKDGQQVKVKHIMFRPVKPRAKTSGTQEEKTKGKKKK